MAIGAPRTGLVTARLLGQLDRGVDHHRALRRRPRHPLRHSDLGLIPTILDRRRERRPPAVRGPDPDRTWATCSANDVDGQPSVRHRHRRLRHCPAT